MAKTTSNRTSSKASNTGRSKPMTPRAGVNASRRTTYSKGGKCGK